MSILRMKGDFDGALAIFDKAIDVADTPFEIARQKAIVLLLRDDAAQASALLDEYYDISTLTLNYAETMCACAVMTKDTEKYDEIVGVLAQYQIEEPEKIVQLKDGKITLEDIYMKGTGEAS